MTTQEFLRILTREIDVLPAFEAQRAITYYREIIEDRIEEGMSEAEAVGSMEDISVIAQQILEDHKGLLEKQQKNEKSQKQHNKWRNALIFLTSPLWLSVFIAVVLLVFSIYIFIWSILISLYICVVAFGLAAFVAVSLCLYDMLPNASLALVELGLSMICIGVLLFGFYGIRIGQRYLFSLQRRWKDNVMRRWRNRRIWQ